MRKQVLIAVIAAILVGGVVFGYRLYDKAQRDMAQTLLAEIRIDQFQLNNGMQVILLTNDRIPAVSHTLWLPIGSADDPAGKSGLAHYLEHLMFKGTPTTPSGEYSRQIERMGGNLNAFTGRDFTGYYVDIAKEYLEQVMALEADRFANLSPDPGEAEKELNVVLEERKSRIDNRPTSLLAEEMQSTLFQHHPYRIPTIGWEHEIEQLTLEDAMNFYRTHYHPANMTLVIAGDVTLEELRPLAEKYYGVLKAKTPYQRHWVDEPEALTKKTVTLQHEDAMQPRLRYAYRMPSLAGDDAELALPLMLLSQLLGEGKTSLLHQALVVDQQVASHVNTSYYGLSIGPSQFSINMTPADGVSLEAAEAALQQALEKLADVSFTDDDIARAKTLLKASAIYARDGLKPIAQFIGYLHMTGLSPDYFVRWPQMIDAVSREDIERAKQSLLSGKAMVAGYLLPEVMEDKTLPDMVEAEEASEKVPEEALEETPEEVPQVNDVTEAEEDEE